MEDEVDEYAEVKAPLKRGHAFALSCIEEMISSAASSRALSPLPGSSAATVTKALQTRDAQLSLGGGDRLARRVAAAFRYGEGQSLRDGAEQSLTISARSVRAICETRNREAPAQSSSKRT